MNEVYIQFWCSEVGCLHWGLCWRRFLCNCSLLPTLPTTYTAVLTYLRYILHAFMKIHPTSTIIIIINTELLGQVLTYYFQFLLLTYFSVLSRCCRNYVLPNYQDFFPNIFSILLNNYIENIISNMKIWIFKARNHSGLEIELQLEVWSERGIPH